MRPESPRIVALFRMSVGAALLLGSEGRTFAEHARIPRALLRAPHGISWLPSLLPIEGATANILAAAFFVSAAFVMVGLYTRLSSAVLLASGVIVLGAAQLTGAVLHDMHLLWFVALLLASRCGDSLSVDAYFRAPARTPHWQRFLGEHAPTVEAALVLFFARTLLGLIYLFPGATKLGTSGLDWALSDNLRNQMHAKWFENGQLPIFRIDHHPWLLHLMGLGTLAFELSFVVLVHVGRRTRIALGLFGILFHLCIQLFLFIPFASLWICYTCLCSSREQRRVPFVLSRAVAPLAGVGMLLVAMNLERGVRGETQSFPFACYPTFADLQPDVLPDLRAVAVDDTGRETLIPLGRDELGRRTQEQWGQAWSVAGIYGAPFSMERFESYLSVERTRPNVARSMQHARIVRVERVLYRVSPDAIGAPPTQTVTLGELSLSTR